MKIKNDNFYAYLLILPFMFFFLSFLIYPFGKLFYMSFYDWNLMAVAINPDNKELKKMIESGATFIPFSMDTVMLHNIRPRF